MWTCCILDYAAMILTFILGLRTIQKLIAETKWVETIYGGAKMQSGGGFSTLYL